MVCISDAMRCAVCRHRSDCQNPKRWWDGGVEGWKGCTRGGDSIQTVSRLSCFSLALDHQYMLIW